MGSFLVESKCEKKYWIVGDAVGLSPLWIIFAIIVCGGLYGILGMLFGVPFVAIIKTWIDRIIEKKYEG